jgi:hypothetical protein
MAHGCASQLGGWLVDGKKVGNQLPSKGQKYAKIAQYRALPTSPLPDLPQRTAMQTNQRRESLSPHELLALLDHTGFSMMSHEEMGMMPTAEAYKG